jgi:hypothetical protein
MGTCLHLQSAGTFCPHTKVVLAWNLSVSAPQKRKSTIEEVVKPPLCYDAQSYHGVVAHQ